MRYFILALLGATLYTFARWNALDSLSIASKAVPVVALLLWLRTASSGTYRRWICLGLLLSLLGDVLLAWPHDLFVFGLGAFLLAHLAYLRAYLSDCLHAAWRSLAVAALTGCAMFTVLAQANIGDLLLPVAFYTTAISAMLWRALARLGQNSISRRSQWLAAVGAALFVVSDSLIGISRFVTPFEGAHVAIMLSYWLGQWGIAASVFKRNA